MSTDAADGDVGPELALRVAIDRVILQAVKEDTERVIRALADVVGRYKQERRFSAEEIDVAEAQLLRELGITRRTN
jgi:hypothetical protein